MLTFFDSPGCRTQSNFYLSRCLWRLLWRRGCGTKVIELWVLLCRRLSVTWTWRLDDLILYCSPTTKFGHLKPVNNTVVIFWLCLWVRIYTYDLNSVPTGTSSHQTFNKVYLQRLHCHLDISSFFTFIQRLEYGTYVKVTLTSRFPLSFCYFVEFLLCLLLKRPESLPLQRSNPVIHDWYFPL